MIALVRLSYIRTYISGLTAHDYGLPYELVMGIFECNGSLNVRLSTPSLVYMHPLHIDGSGVCPC